MFLTTSKIDLKREKFKVYFVVVMQWHQFFPRWWVASHPPSYHVVVHILSFYMVNQLNITWISTLYNKEHPKATGEAAHVPQFRDPLLCMYPILSQNYKLIPYLAMTLI